MGDVIAKPIQHLVSDTRKTIEKSDTILGKVSRTEKQIERTVDELQSVPWEGLMKHKPTTKTWHGLDHSSSGLVCGNVTEGFGKDDFDPFTYRRCYCEDDKHPKMKTKTFDFKDADGCSIPGQFRITMNPKSVSAANACCNYHDACFAGYDASSGTYTMSQKDCEHILDECLLKNKKVDSMTRRLITEATWHKGNEHFSNLHVTCEPGAWKDKRGWTCAKYARGGQRYFQESKNAKCAGKSGSVYEGQNGFFAFEACRQSTVGSVCPKSKYY